MEKIFQATLDLSQKQTTMPDWEFEEERKWLIRWMMCVLIKEAVALYLCEDSGVMTFPVNVLSHKINQLMPPKYMFYLGIGYQVLESQIPPSSGVLIDLTEA